MKKKFDPETAEGIFHDPVAVQGYNQALEDTLAVLQYRLANMRGTVFGNDVVSRADVKALLQETLGEGKEINSIFKE